MQKPPTGEPYAGKPPVRFGGRGRRKPIPTPIPISRVYLAIPAAQLRGRRRHLLPRPYVLP
jgi:hypothetical protein